ncbi:hypothetical protein [Leptospira levettii]|uniref:hypothetical protein n=1 Tax=Leptospira levettii TaxID=2023178 RepID=UPI003EBD414A
MAATAIEKIPSLKGQNAKDFVEKAEATELSKVVVSEQQKKIYVAFTSKNLTSKK